MKTILLAACCGPLAGVIAAPAMAQTLSIENFAGRVEIRTADTADVQVEITPGRDGAAPSIQRGAAGVTVTGGYDRQRNGDDGGQDCRGEGADREIRFEHGGDYHRFSDLPLIRVTAPADLDLHMDDVSVDGFTGPLGSADIGLTGCVRLEIAQVARDLKAELLGASELTVGDVGGGVDLDFAGGGPLVIGDIAGLLDADIAGAGDFRIGAVRGGADIDMAGAGEVTIAEMSGDLDLDLAGAGEMNIERGQLGLIEVDVAGVGNVRYGGAARLARVNVFGFGEVEIAQADDVDVTSAGLGEVRVNGRRAR